MKLVELKEKEYEEFATNHEQASFLQTICWAKLKEKNGWKYELLGFKEGKKIIAATMLLSKKTPLKKKMFYAPRGFLIDYTNFELLEEFTKKMKEYVKKENGIFLKIDPYIMYHQRDTDGKIVENGIDNSKVVENVKKLGFVEQCAKPGEQSLQAKWMYWLPLKNKTLDEILKNMSYEKRRVIKLNEKNGMVLREGTYDDLKDFKHILDHTGERRNFIVRPLKYYQEMYKAFGNGKYLKVFFTDLHIKEKLNEFKKEQENLQKAYDDLISDIEKGKRKMSENKLNLKVEEIDRVKKKIDEYEKLYKEHGEVLTTGTMLYFIYGKEVLSLIGGSYDKYMEFQSSYSMNYEMIKYAIENNYEYYNFYGISSDLTEKDPMYGVYLFKKGFGGEVVELIGEYDLKILPFYYYLYKISYSVVHKLKKIKTKLH